MNRRNLLKCGLASASAAMLPVPAFAYPDRPIKLIVPFSPSDVPKPIVERIAAATTAAMKDAEVQKAIVNSGFEPIPDSGPDAAQRMVASELARWNPIIRATGFKVQ